MRSQSNSGLNSRPYQGLNYQKLKDADKTNKQKNPGKSNLFPRYPHCKRIPCSEPIHLSYQQHHYWICQRALDYDF